MNTKNDLKVGDRIIITKVDRDDYRRGLRGDALGVVKTVHSSGYYTVEMDKDGAWFYLAADQVKLFRG